jgi:HSP20 family protein
VLEVMPMAGLIPFGRSFLTDVFDNDWFEPIFNRPWMIPGDRSMFCDIKELDDKYVMEIDLPGVKKEDIDISLDNGLLTISARAEEAKEDKGKYIVKERRMQTCQRSFRVGDRITKDNVRATFENGVLTLTIDKKGGEPKDTKIDVN